MPLIGSRGAGSIKAFGLTSGGFSGILANGGTVTEYGIYKLHTFNGSGQFSISAQGNSPGAGTFDYFFTGGGGGGAGAVVHGEGGGGGAGVGSCRPT